MKTPTFLLDAVGLVGEKIISSASTILVFIVASKYLPQSQFGLWLYAVAAAQFAASCIGPSMEQIVIGRYIQSNNRIALIKSARRVSAALSVAAIMLSLLVAAAGKTELSYLLPVMLPILLGQLLIPVGTITEMIGRAEGKTKQIVLLRLAVTLLSALLKIWLLTTGMEVRVVAIAFLMESVTHSILVHYVCGRSKSIYRSDLTSSQTSDQVLNLAHIIVPAVVSGVAVAAFFRVSYFLVEKLSTLDQLALYGVCFTLFQTVLMIPQMVISAMMPQLSLLWRDNKDSFNKRVSELMRSFAAVAYILALLSLCIPESAVFALFGGKYSGLTSTFPVVMASAVPVLSAAVRAVIINFLGLTKLHLVSAIFGGLFLTLTSSFLVPKFGATGAGWSLLFSSIVSGIGTSFFFQELRPYGLQQLRALMFLK